MYNKDKLHGDYGFYREKQMFKHLTLTKEAKGKQKTAIPIQFHV